MMKKALIVAPGIPYPIDGGNKVALHGYIVALRAAGYGHLTLICYAGDGLYENGGLDKVVRVEKPKRLRVSMLLSLMIGRSVLLRRFHSNNISLAINSELASGGYSVLLFQHAYMAQHARDIDVANLGGVKTVVSSEVLESRAYLEKARLSGGLKGWFFRREAKILDSEETGAISGFDCVTFFSEEDKSHYLRNGGAPSGAELVNLGLDLDRYRLLPPRLSDGALRLCFFGSFSWFANLDALEFLLKEVWPQIFRRVPNAELHIAGRDVPEWVATANLEKVFVHGRVPSIEGFLAETDIVLSPIRIGGGVRLKMLEAMAMGRPVISTVSGVEGLEPGLVELINVARSVDEFAELVEMLGGGGAGAGSDSVRLVRSQYDARSLARLF